jgi:hypothetical protein
MEIYDPIVIIMGTGPSHSSTTVANPPVKVPGNPGGNGGVQMALLPIKTTDVNSAITLSIGQGGGAGKPGGPTKIILHNGSSDTAGGGKSNGAVGEGGYNRNNKNIANYITYGQGGGSDQPGSDGYGIISVFTLSIAKK